MTVVLGADYYKRVLEENGYESLRDELKPIDFALGNLNPSDLSLSWLCHHDGDEFARHVAGNREKVKIITGIGLSGTPHLGTLSQMLKAIRLQQNTRIPVKFVLGDLDAYNGKSTPLASAKALGDRVRRFMLDLGFDDTGDNELRGQYDELEILRTMYLTGFFIDDEDFNSAEEDLHSFYVEKGKVDNSMSYRRKLSLALMVAGWFHQQIEKGESKLLITLGIDEHQYVRFAQRLLKKMQQAGEFSVPLKDALISAIYSTLIKGFNNYPKMSKSFPESGIHLDMSREQVEKLIMNGEGDYSAPEDSVVFQCISNASTYSPEEIHAHHKLCQEGGAAWTEAKRDYVHHLSTMLERWQAIATK